jgi:hypothetical protein
MGGASLTHAAMLHACGSTLAMASIVGPVEDIKVFCFFSSEKKSPYP